MRLESTYSFLVDIRIGRMGWYWSKCVNWRSPRKSIFGVDEEGEVWKGQEQ